MYSIAVHREFCAAHALTMGGQVEPLHGHNWKVEAVIEEILQPLGLPLVTGLPFGHLRANATWTLGARATIDGASGEVRILERGVSRVP